MSHDPDKLQPRVLKEFWDEIICSLSLPLGTMELPQNSIFKTEKTVRALHVPSQNLEWFKDMVLEFRTGN